MSGRPLSEVTRLVEAGGETALADLGGGPFLIEIPLQNPLGRTRPATRAGTSIATMAFDEQLLLDLKRTRSDEEARVYALRPGDVVGRSGACAIPLAGEESVSKEHARFSRTDAGWRLEDLGTTNGTFVDGARLQGPAELGPLVALQVGGRRFAFVSLEDLVALLSPVRAPEAVSVAQLRTELDALGGRRFALRHASPYLLAASKGVDGASATDFRPTEAFALVGDGPLRIGRTSQAEVTLKRGSVSKWHARLTPHEHRWSLEDTGSSNGTFVNGRRLPQGERARLKSWDALAFGPSTWGLYLEPRALLEWLTER